MGELSGLMSFSPESGLSYGMIDTDTAFIGLSANMKVAEVSGVISYDFADDQLSFAAKGQVAIMRGGAGATYELGAGIVGASVNVGIGLSGELDVKFVGEVEGLAIISANVGYEYVGDVVSDFSGLLTDAYTVRAAIDAYLMAGLSSSDIDGQKNQFRLGGKAELVSMEQLVGHDGDRRTIERKYGSEVVDFLGSAYSYLKYKTIGEESSSTDIVVVPSSLPSTGTRLDLFKGNTYDSDAPYIGHELSALDLLAAQSATLDAQHRAPGTPTSFGDGDSTNDNDWRLPPSDPRHSSNNPSSPGTTPDRDRDRDRGDGPEPASSGTTSRDVDALEGPEATAPPPPRPPVNVPSGNPGGNAPPQPVTPGTGGLAADDPNRAGAQPILFDLDGNGIQITELSDSSIYIDATGDGLDNRTAWAGAGDAVLFYDPDNTGEITEMRQYVFTEWDPTAASDMEALASVFDTNGDGVLSGSELDDFKVMITNEDGSTEAVSLTEVLKADGTKGITSIDLTADATNIELPDGSVITGQTTFTWDDGTTGTVADVTLIAEADGHRIEQVESLDANGTRTEVTTGYDADGSIDFVNTTVVTSDGAQIANTYDDNGDGVVDRLQTIDIFINDDGSTVKTVTNSLGAVAATAILLNQTQTTTSADGNTITIARDSIGGGWFDQTEVRTTAVDGSMTIVTTDVGQDGTVIRSVDESVSVDGLTRTEEIDSDGDGLTDVTMTHVIVVNPDGSRSETMTLLNQDGSIRSVATETVSSDGQTKTLSSDVDGDGAVDTVIDSDIVTGTTDSTSTVVVSNGNGTTRSTTTYVQSDDALTKSSASDIDGDGDIDVTTLDQTVLNPDGSRINTITMTNTDGSIRGMEETTLGADQVTSSTHVDLNQNGIFETTDLVRSVTVDTTTGDRTATVWDRNADGSFNATSTSVTSADGLTRMTTSDLDGDGDIDATTSDVTTVNGSGEATRTVTVSNQDGSLRSETISVTSADGLSTTTTFDTDGDGVLDGTRMVSQTSNPDGTVVRTSSTYAGDGVTLLSHSVSTQSADRRIVTTDTDSNGDGSVDLTVVSTQAVDGSRSLEETRFHADGTISGTQTTSLSANGLITTVATDADGDGVDETVSTQTTVLNTDGSRTLTTEIHNNDGSLRSQNTVTTSDDGLTITSQTDADGDGVDERTGSSVMSLNGDGSVSTLSETFAENGDLLAQTLLDTSDDGLVVTQSTDADGDGAYDLTRTTTTTLLADGGTTTTNEVRDSADVLRAGSTTTISDDGRQVTRTVDSNGDGNADQVSVTTEADDGTLTSTTSQLAADGSVQSSSETEVSANGLATTVSQDRDGDGTVDLMMTEVTTLNADGSVTQTTTDLGGNGTAYSSSTTVTSDDGRTTTRTNDYDADGVVDLTVVSTTDIALDGTQTQTSTRTAADGTTLGVLSVETSADGRTVTTNNDTDGNGLDDLRTTTVVEDNGVRTSTTEFLTSSGVVDSTYQVITSGDELSTTRLTDRNGDGEIDLRSVESAAVGLDGTVTRTVEHRGQHHVLVGREEYSISDDGMAATSSLDLDGNGVFDFITDIETTYAANGDVMRHQETRSISSDILSDISTTTSGDGLTTNVSADYSGDGSIDRTAVIERGADGGFTSIVQQYGAGYDLQQTTTQTVSADGRSSTQTIDLDGDGFVDQQINATIDLSGNTTTTYQDIEINGDVTTTITSVEAANGMNTSFSFDVDGDGATDITRTTDISYEADGDMVRTFTETYGNNVVYEETTTTAADGLSYTSTFDVDGDGDIDGTTSSVTTLNADGSRETVTQTQYTDGELHSSVVETVSADGRTTTREMDYDGNGVADKVSETVVASDGSRIETESSFNEAGVPVNTFVTTTSADRLTTTVMREGNVQTTTRSVLDNGSYEWDNGVASSVPGHMSSSHEVDGLGVETWSLTIKTGSVTEQFEVRLDAEAKAQLFDEAEAIFDTVLDRGLDSDEREELIRFVEDGELDQVALTDHLMESNEYTTRYDTMTDAEFVAQTYMNTFGRGPSMGELGEHLSVLNANYATRAEIALELAESIEHSVVGNGHVLTNNFDVIMNPAVFERSLDRAYVESVVTNMVDTIYDRPPTEQELAYLSDLLLEGDKQPEDIAEILLGVDGDIQGVSSSTLHGLSGEELVEQSFINSLGRMPTDTELTLWVNYLEDGVLTQAQFIASLAQSTEHLEEGNTHIQNATPTVTTITGTSGNDALKANDGTTTGPFGTVTVIETDDPHRLEGEAGNDTLGGSNGSDYLVGGTGNDTLRGWNGSDFYEWATGDGNDTIDENGGSRVETDTLVLTDVNADGITLTRADGSSALVITIDATGETITVDEQYSDTNLGRGIEGISFADGTSWDLADIGDATAVTGPVQTTAEALAGIPGAIDGTAFDDNLFGLNGNDTLIGNAGDDTLVGGLGNDTLKGGSGGDAYVWSRGEGNDRIEDLGGAVSDVDTLVLTDVNSTDVTLTRWAGSDDEYRDVRISISGGPSTETIVIADQFWGGQNGVELIVFADGVVWDREDIILSTAINGGSGNDEIIGFSQDDIIMGHGGNDELQGGYGNDWLYGGTGNDHLEGGQGGDTYVWARGDGSDTIDEEDSTNATQTDHLILEDVISTDVTLTRINTTNSEHQDDLYINVHGDATIGVRDQFKANGEGIEQITFADGVVWTREDILTRTRIEGTNGDDAVFGISAGIYGSGVRDNLYGLGGDDVIDAGSGDDWLFGGTGNDTLWGDGGNDTYVWEEGDGNDVIRDTSATSAETDTLLMRGVNSDEVSLSRNGNDLIVTFDATGETITVTDRFAVGTTGDGDGVEFIRFEDGVIVEVLGGELAETITHGTAASNTLNGWGLEDTLYGYEGNDTLNGFGGDDALIGGAGNDNLNGGGGNDIYIWAAGDGNDVINDVSANVTETDHLVLTDIPSDGVVLERPDGGSSLEITIVSTGEMIVITDQFHPTVNGRGIEEITFSDGVTWNLNDIYEHTVTLDDHSGNVTGSRFDDNLYGLEGEDPLNMYGLEGEDTLDGFAGDDDLFGGEGADLLRGGEGNDTYHWSSGDGNDVIDDSASAIVATDTLSLTGVLPGDVAFERVGDSEDLRVIVQGDGSPTAADGALLYEYYQGSWSETTGSFWNQTTVWSADFIPTTGADGAGIRTDTSVTGIDNTHGGDGDFFGVRMVGVIEVDVGGTYTFTTGSDDGSLLWINGVQVVDNDGLHGYRERDGTITLGPGQHTIEISYIEHHQGDVLNVFVEGPDTGGVRTELFDSEMLGDAADAANLLNVDATEFPELEQQQEVIIVKDQFSDADLGAGIEAITFDDGTIWTYEDIMTMTQHNGTDENDILNGTAYDDNISGFDGDDTINGGAGDDVITGGDGIDQIATGSGNDIAYGEDGNDTLISTEGADQLFGGAGDDLFQTEGYGELIDGGAGNDTFDFSSQTQDYIVNLSTGNIGWLGNSGIGIITGVENIIGGSGNDNLTGNADDNVLEGRAGDDALNGGAGNDILTGGAGDDTLIGGSGDDILSGGGGLDSFDGGAGVDTADFSYSTGDVDLNLVTEEAVWASAIELLIGIENVIGSNGDNTITGTSGDNILDGQDGDDTINGGDGNDRLIGGGGTDTLNGGDGDDYIADGFGAGIMDGGAGSDTVDVSHSDTNNTVNLGAGTITWGSGGTESAINFENVITGGGNNTIIGTADANTFDAGAGNDIMTGGAGVDTFVFDLGDGDDRVTDFENGIDLIDLSATGLSFGDLTITTNGGDTIVSYGNGDEIELDGTSGQIDQSDFIFV